MKQLIVLCGPPGCGKTTLIEEYIKKNKNFEFVDIFQYIKKYKNEDGSLVENGSLLAHQDMYSYLNNTENNIILELGTNRVEFNFGNIKELTRKYRPMILICLLDKNVCIDRTLNRMKSESGRNYPSREYLEEKFKRGFPQKHMGVAKDLSIPFMEFNMDNNLDQLILNLENLVNNYE